MNINIICEVNDALYNLVKNNDNSLHSKILNNISNSLTPDDVFLSDFTKTVTGMRLICLFGEEQEVIDAVNQLELDFPDPAFNVLAAFNFTGLQYGLSYDDTNGVVGVPVYPYVENDLLKYTDDIDLTVDRFWRTSDTQPRKFIA